MKIDSLREIFNKKAESIIVVDIGSKLSLFDVELKGKIKINASKIIELTNDRKDEIILRSLCDFIESNGITHKDAILRIDLSSLVIKRLQLPVMPDKELREALRWQLKEDIPFDLDNAVLDFSIIKKTTRDDGSQATDIMCAIADKNEIVPFVSILKKAKLSCLSVGLLPFGYAKLIEQRYIDEKINSFGILHLLKERCYLVLFENKKLTFYRELPLSLKKLKDALRVPIVTEKKTIELSDTDIEEILHTMGLSTEKTTYKESLSSSQIFSLVRPHFERLAEEIRRSLRYYESQLKGEEISKLLLVGVAAKIPHLNSFLHDELSCDVEHVSLAQNIAATAQINLLDISDNYATLGLALDYEKNINLLPYELRTEKIENVQKISLRWVAFISFLLLAVSFLFIKAKIHNAQKRLDAILLQTNVLSEIKEVKKNVDEFNSFVTQVRDSAPHLGEFFKMLSSVSPQQLFLKKLSLDCRAKKGSLTGFIKGIERNPDVVLAEFIRSLENSGYFADASINSVERREYEGIEFADFLIAVTLL